MEKGRMFGVPFVESQWPLIKRFCWGPECGHGQMGAIHIDDTLAVIPCRREDCPALEKQLDEPVGEVNGEGLYLRKLHAPVGQERKVRT